MWFNWIVVVFVVRTNGVFVSLYLRHAHIDVPGHCSRIEMEVMLTMWSTQESGLSDSKVTTNICQIDLDFLLLFTIWAWCFFWSVCLVFDSRLNAFWHCRKQKQMWKHIAVTIIDFIQCCPLKLSHCQLHLGISKSVDFNFILQTFYRANKSHFTLVWLIPHKLSLCLWRWLTIRGDWVWRLSGLYSVYCTRSEQ